MGMRSAIDAMCKSCLWDPRAEGLGTWRQQIEACTDSGCPLYPHRPRSQGLRHRPSGPEIAANSGHLEGVAWTA